MRLLIRVAAVALLLAGGRASAAPELIDFYGMCDASAVVTLTNGDMLVVDDRSDILRTFRPDGGVARARADLYDHTHTPRRSRRPFSAFEGAARIGDTIYLITSHSREEKGKNRPNRRRFLAVEAIRTGETERVQAKGKSYIKMKEQLIGAPELRNLGLQRYIMEIHRELPFLAPQKQGLNIEGLSSSRDGGVLIGLRNPRPGNRALVLPVQNPERVILGMSDPDFGDPIRLDLGGLGIASMAWVPQQDAYYVVAAPHDRDGETRLYRWSGDPKEAPALVQEIRPADFATEGLAASPDGKRLLLVSDDGDRPVAVGEEACHRSLAEDGTCPCGFLEKNADKGFRGQWIDLPPTPGSKGAS